MGTNFSMETSPSMGTRTHENNNNLMNIRTIRCVPYIVPIDECVPIDGYDLAPIPIYAAGSWTDYPAPHFCIQVRPKATVKISRWLSLLLEVQHQLWNLRLPISYSKETGSLSCVSQSYTRYQLISAFIQKFRLSKNSKKDQLPCTPSPFARFHAKSIVTYNASRSR